MNIGVSKLVGAGVFFLLIFVTGFWLSRSGKPYGPVLFNVHKLIALAALVFLLVTYTQAHKGIPITRLEWGVGMGTLVCYVALVISGGLLNLPQPLPGALLWLHRLLPFLALAGTAASLYLARSVAMLH